MGVMSCMLLYHNWRLTLLTMWTIPLLVFLTIFIGKLYHRYHRIVWRRVEKISTILASTIPGVRVVKVFGRESDEVDRFNFHSKHVLESGLVVGRLALSITLRWGF